jgi:uncharacterized membrane protein
MTLALNEEEERKINEVKTKEEAKELVSSLRERIKKIRDYTYRFPMVVILEESEEILKGEANDEIAVHTIKILSRTVFKYLKL